MMFKNKMMTIVLTSIVLSLSFVINPAIASSKAGAFLGGMVTSRVLTNMHQRTQAEQQQAYYAQQNAQQNAQPVQQAAPAPAAQTQQQKLDQLDKLAAGGYVTPDEYKARKKAIIDGS